MTRRAAGKFADGACDADVLPESADVLRHCAALSKRADATRRADDSSVQPDAMRCADDSSVQPDAMRRADDSSVQPDALHRADDSSMQFDMLRHCDASSKQPDAPYQADKRSERSPTRRYAVVSPVHPDAQALMAELTAELARITGCGGQASFDASGFADERACFVVAYDGDAPLACGGFHPLTVDTAELKRVYAKRRGEGAPLLAWLENRARALGYRRMVCETRRVNENAVAFYGRNGYREIAPFDKYVGRAEAICFGKAL